ncbi:MAG: hypothetical protein H7A46_06940 [Verrucomicrobiales bacterium]|nr:hypothetical protein [Verrucomicrobiales bacterium]
MNAILKTIPRLLVSGVLAAVVLAADPPGILNHQGVINAEATPFNGTGSFKFALMNGALGTTLWSNDGTSTGGSEPTDAVSLSVSNGRYSVALGDTGIANMTAAIPASAFTDNADVRLRVWFDDGVNGSQQLSPDQRLASVGYALSAAQAQGVADGAITSAKIAVGTVIPAQAIAGTSQAAAVNTGYTATSELLTYIDLPTTANVGDTVQISGAGTGGWVADLQPDQWTPQESNRNWRSVASSDDGSKLVAVVDGGQIYTSTDCGANWTPRESNRSWQSVASSADGSKLVAVAWSGQIYTSTDSGANWTPRESDRQWQSVASSTDGSKLVAVVYNGQIYTSTDSGVSWTPRESDRSWHSVASSADGIQLVAAPFGSEIYTSTDSGESWTAQENIRYWVSVASSADGSKLVALVNGGQIYTSTDFGVNWTARESNRNWWSVASSADGSRLVALDNAGQIYTSTDSGVSWTARESNRDWLSVASSADGTKLAAVVQNGQIYTSDSTVASGAQGTTATLQYLGSGQWKTLGGADATVTSAQIAPGAVNSSHIAPGTLNPAQTVPGTSQAAVANASYVATSASLTTFDLSSTPANVGDTVLISGAGTGGWVAELYQPDQWTPRESNRQWATVASSADGSKLVALVYDGQIYTSTDYGASWTARDSTRNWLYVASSADGSKLVALVDGGQIYTSTDSGVSWTARESDRNWSGVASSADGSKLVAAEQGGQIYTSTDSGVSWTARESDRNWSGVASSADGSKLVAADYGGRIYTSTDSGVSWTPQESNRSWVSVASSADGTKLVATVGGWAASGQIYTSTDSGESWTPRESVRHWGFVASSTDGSRLVAGVQGGQIYTSTDSGVSWTARESSRVWNGVASSADGNKLVALAGQIYTSGTITTGAQGTSATLQYLGNGQWTLMGPDASVGQWSASGNNVFRTAGSVGIGTANPSHALTVVSAEATYNNPVMRVQSQNTGSLGSSAIGFFDETGTQEAWVGLNLGTGLVGGQGGLQVYTASSKSIALGDDDGGIDVVLNGATDRVGIGTASPSEKLHVIGNILASGTVTGSSDRNVKENFVPVDPREVLERVSAMPIQRWNYIGETTPHLGPVAQDFYSAFQVGMDDKHISMVDADGVALAAIQGLNEKLEARSQKLVEENAALKARLERLEQLLTPQVNGGTE